MKIDEIIKKSIEIPGISIKRGEFSAELILKERDRERFHDFFSSVPRSYIGLYFCEFSRLDSPRLSR